MVLVFSLTVIDSAFKMDKLQERFNRNQKNLDEIFESENEFKNNYEEVAKENKIFIGKSKQKIDSMKKDFDSNIESIFNGKLSKEVKKFLDQKEENIGFLEEIQENQKIQGD